jgi:hypothetical protein
MIEGIKRQQPIQQKKVVIDPSKISNLDLEQMTEEQLGTLSNTIDSPLKSKKSGKFNFSKAEIIPLPSKGLLYRSITTDTDILDGKIRLRAMTVQDEKILSTKRYIQSGSSIRMVLESCIESDIDASQLLLFDANFLLFRLRQISHGDEYEFPLTCDNGSCEKKFNHKVFISKQQFEELPEGFVEPIISVLPQTKYVIHSKLPRLTTSEELKRLDANKVKKIGEADDTISVSMKLNCIKILDPEGSPVPRSDWDEFFDALPSMDSSFLRRNTKFDSGVDKLSNIVCPWCEATAEYSIPITTEFFRF